MPDIQKVEKQPINNNNWPFDPELELYYRPHGWAVPRFRFEAKYEQFDDMINWLNEHKKSIWWTCHSNMLYMTFRKHTEYTLFMLKWG